MSTDPSSIADEYLQLLDLTYQVVDSLKDEPSPDSRWPDCQQLAAKLLFHATTVYCLGEAGTKAPVPYSLQGCFFYDFPSTAVLTRAILETYLTMFEVFFEPATDDEFEFSHALWLLSALVIREHFIPSDLILRRLVADAQAEIQQMRLRLRSTRKFRSLTPGQKTKVLKGERITSWKSVAAAAGFGAKAIQEMYTYYSGYVHADGPSSIQIATAEPAHDQIEHIESHMRLIMTVLSKTIVDYAKRFPQARSVCQTNLDAYRQAEMLSRAVSRLP